MKNQINMGQFVIMYEVICDIYVAQILNKTKTHQNENDIYIFNSYQEMIEYFKKEI